MDTDPRNRGGEAGNVAGDVLDRDPKSLQKRDLPEPLPLRKILGPGIVMVGVSMAAGEFILWPFVTSIAGLGVLWLAVAALGAQMFINTEIERYTLATGETAVTGFARFWKPWGLFFCLAAIFQYAWPGWASGASTVLTFALGVGEGWVVPITIISLFLIGIALTISPVIYKTVEKVEFFKVGATIFFLVVVVVGVISFRAWSEAPAQVVGGIGQIPAGLSIALVLGAIGAAGRRGRDVHLLGPAGKAEPQRPAQRHQDPRVPPRGPGSGHTLLRLLLRPAGDQPGRQPLRWGIEGTP